MSKQELSQFPLPGKEKGIDIEKRYYVQHLTEQIFVVRERLLDDGAARADDRIVRSFQIGHDAYQYASSMNDAQGTPHIVATSGRGRLSKKPL
jgi:hypothetical protein